MSNNNEIKSLAGLKKRQRELVLEMEVSKRELAHSMGASRESLQDFLLKKVALPAGGTILGLYLLHKALNHTSQPPQSSPTPTAKREQAGAAAGANEGPKNREPTHKANPAPARIPLKRVPSGRKSSFDFTKLASFGKIVIPAAQAIMAVVKEQNGQQK